MSNGMNEFWNGMMSVAQAVNRNKQERSITKALEEMMKQQGGNSNSNSNTGDSNSNGGVTLGQLAQAMSGDNAVTPAQLAQNAAANNSYDFARDLSTLNSQSSNPYLRYGGYGTNQQGNTQSDTAQASPYNAGNDYGVDLNNPYSMAIMNAKNDYYRAQKLGDENAMLRANQVAEQARAQAQEAGVPIQSFLSGNNTDYATAVAMNDQLRQAQVNGNQNFSYADLANGKMLTPQTTNPTQGLNEQQPTSAGTATATPAKGVTTPSVGNQQTAQTQTAPNTYDIQAGYNQMMNQINGGSAQQNPFLGAGRRWGL